MSNQGKPSYVLPRCLLLFFWVCPQIALTSEPRPMDQSQKRILGTFPLTEMRKVEILLEEVKMEHDYNAPPGKLYKELWLVLQGVIVSPIGRKPIWRVNYIEHFRDTQFTRPKHVPRDFQVVERDEHRIGVAFVVPPDKIAFYQVDLRKGFSDPSAPPKVPPGTERDFHYVVEDFYCTSIWRHQLPLWGSLREVLGSQEAKQLLNQESLRIVEIRWDKTEERWIAGIEVGPYQIEFTSRKEHREDEEPTSPHWQFSRLIRRGMR